MRKLFKSGVSNKGGKTGFSGKIFLSGFFSFFLLFGIVFIFFMLHSFFENFTISMWDKHECQIIESSVTEKSSVFFPELTYEYEIGGKKYLSEQISTADEPMKYRESVEFLEKHSPGTTLKCFVNPSSHQEAYLYSPVKWLLLPFLIIPLIFVFTGGGVIYSIWFKGGKKEKYDSGYRGESVSFDPKNPDYSYDYSKSHSHEKESDKDINTENKQSSHKKKSSKGRLVFFSIFFIIGLIFLYFFGIRIWLKYADARDWKQLPCKIMSSRISRHCSSSGSHGSSTTYKVEISYKFSLNGKEYIGDSYDFANFSSSGYSAKKKIISKYPEGRETVCYVDINNPENSVINRDFSLVMLIGLIPMVFVIIGIVGIIKSLRNKGKS